MTQPSVCSNVFSFRRIAVVLAFCALVFVAFSPSQASADTTAQIVSGKYWLDTSGNFILGHTAGVIKGNDGLYYWFGVDLPCTGLNVGCPSSDWNGVTCYSSSDLQTWTYHGYVITPQASGPFGPGVGVRAPRVLYNASTSTYVMWLHYVDTSGQTWAAVAKFVPSPSALCGGSFTYVNKFQPGGVQSADIGVFKDTNSTAYLMDVAQTNPDSIYITQLTSNYQGITGSPTVAVANIQREAPTMVKNGSTYYLFTSGETGWAPDQEKYATATSITGTWSSLQNVGNNLRDYSQVKNILPIQGTQGTTILTMADRFQGKIGDVTWCLNCSRYVWLPLVFNGSTPTLNWYSNWTLNLTTGTWSTAEDPGQLACFDDLEDNSASDWTTSGGNWSVFTPSGSPIRHWYKKASSGTTTNNVALREDRSLTDYYVQADVDLTASGSVSVIGRAQDLSNYYQLTLSNGANQNWAIYAVVNGNLGTAIASGSFTPAYNTWYELRLTMDGTTLSAQVSSDDGDTWTALGSPVTDTTYSSGWMGVKGYNALSYYDNISAVGLGGGTQTCDYP